MLPNPPSPETIFSDPKLLVAFASLVISAAVATIGFMRRKSPPEQPPIDPRALYLQALEDLFRKHLEELSRFREILSTNTATIASGLHEISTSRHSYAEIAREDRGRIFNELQAQRDQSRELRDVLRSNELQLSTLNAVIASIHTQMGSLEIAIRRLDNGS